MAKRSTPEEQLVEETVSKIPEKAVRNGREACEKSRISMFEQLGTILVEMQDVQVKADKKIADEYNRLNPANYNRMADISTQDALKVLEKNPATKFGLMAMGAETSKKIFGELSNQTIEGFLSKTYGSGEEAAIAATRVGEEVNTLFGYYTDTIEKNQGARKKQLRESSDALTSNARLVKERYSREIKKDFYGSTAFMLYERTNMFWEQVDAINKNLEKEEAEILKRVYKIKQGVIENVVQPHTGMHYYFENKENVEAYEKAEAAQNTEVTQKEEAASETLKTKPKKKPRSKKSTE